MRKTGMVSVIALLICLATVAVTNAEMANEGSGTSTNYYVATAPKVFAQEKERLQIIYEAIRVLAADDKADPFHHSSIQCVGAARVEKGVSKEMGLCTATRPDADKIYMSYEGSGKPGVEAKGTFEIAGGTGKCAGITGTGEFERKYSQRPTKEHSVSFAKHKYSWKIPRSRSKQLYLSTQ